MSFKDTLSTYWVHLQAALLPWLDEAPDGPLTAIQFSAMDMHMLYRALGSQS